MSRELKDGAGGVLFVFVDGIGLAPPGVENPLSQVPMPGLERVLGGPLVRDDGAPGTGLPTLLQADEGLVFGALDACLGVAGLPQSATGQTALFTGVNAAAAVGEHVTAFPTPRLREIIAEQSLLKRAHERGAGVLFANAHSRRFWEMVDGGRRRMGASTLTALAAGIPIPTLKDIEAGDAVLWDITHEISTGHFGYELPLVPAEVAGARLAGLTSRYDLVMYETFLPDLAGHRRLEPEWVLTRLDGLLGGILAALPGDVTMVLCSDHGNLEDMSTRGHTKNAVPLIVLGPKATRFREAKAITDVTPLILDALAE